MTLLLAIFVVLFVSIGSACATDVVSDVDSNINLNSEEIIANSNGIDNCDEEISSQSSIAVNDVNGNTSDSEISSESVSNVNTVPTSTNNVKEDAIITSIGASKTITVQQVSTTSNSVENYTIKQIMDASSLVKSYVEKNKALPSTVTIGSKSISIAKYCYLASMAIQYLNAGKSTNTIVKALEAKGNSAKYSINENVYTANYVKAARYVSNSFTSRGAALSYVTVPTNKADYRVYTYGFAKILAYYKNNGALPNYCRFNSTAFDEPTPKNTYTISQILTASANVKNYVEKNMVLPATVTIGSDTLPVAKYCYLAAMAVQYLKSGKSISTTIKALEAKGNSAIYSINENVYTNNYVNAARYVSNSFTSRGVALSYVTVPTNKADYRVYTYGFAKILAYYKNNGALPNYCRFNSTAFIITPTTNTTFSYNQIMIAANTLKSYVETYHSLPVYVEVGSYSVTVAQFSYLESTLIKELSTGKSSGSVRFVNVSTPSNINKTVNINPTKSVYVDAATRVSDYSKEKGAIPSYVTINEVDVPFNLYTYAFAKILVWYKSNNKTLPSTCTFNSSVFSSACKVPTNLRYSKGINERAGVIDKATYLKLSGHCASNSQIKSLAQSLTKNCKNDWEKAEALFNYVRDYVSYSSYYNSVYDATGTLSRKAGNCCDQTNLLVSLCRNAGLACRYCHGNPCYFSSGLTVGHVWAQIYIESSNEGPVWVAADPVSTRNSLGYIVNWNSMGTLNQYSLLPF